MDRLIAILLLCIAGVHGLSSCPFGNKIFSAGGKGKEKENESRAIRNDMIP